MNCDNRSVSKIRSFLSRLLLVVVFRHNPSDCNWRTQVPTTACQTFYSRATPSALPATPSGESVISCVQARCSLSRVLHSWVHAYNLTIALRISISNLFKHGHLKRCTSVRAEHPVVGEELELSRSFTTPVPGGSRLSLGEQPSRRRCLCIILPAVENAFQFAPLQDAL